MSERPVLFNSEMVKAILAGRKRQTRRLVKCNANGRGECGLPTHVEFSRSFETDLPQWWADPGGWITMPWAVGDTLWVGETHRVNKSEGDGKHPLVAYRADDVLPLYMREGCVEECHTGGKGCICPECEDGDYD